MQLLWNLYLLRNAKRYTFSTKTTAKCMSLISCLLLVGSSVMIGDKLMHPCVEYMFWMFVSNLQYSLCIVRNWKCVMVFLSLCNHELFMVYCRWHLCLQHQHWHCRHYVWTVLLSIPLIIDVSYSIYLCLYAHSISLPKPRWLWPIILKWQPF